MTDIFLVKIKQDIFTCKNKNNNNNNNILQYVMSVITFYVKANYKTYNNKYVNYPHITKMYK